MTGGRRPVTVEGHEGQPMPTISVLSDPPHGFRAIAGDRQATGRTVGQAVDGLGADPDETTLIVVQPQRPATAVPAEELEGRDG